MAEATKQISLRLPESLLESIEEQAEEQELNRTELIVQLLRSGTVSQSVSQPQELYPKVSPTVSQDEGVLSLPNTITALTHAVQNLTEEMKLQRGRSTPSQVSDPSPVSQLNPSHIPNVSHEEDLYPNLSPDVSHSPPKVEEDTNDAEVDIASQLHPNYIPDESHLSPEGDASESQLHPNVSQPPSSKPLSSPDYATYETKVQPRRKLRRGESWYKGVVGTTKEHLKRACPWLTEEQLKKGHEFVNSRAKRAPTDERDETRAQAIKEKIEEFEVERELEEA